MSKVQRAIFPAFLLGCILIVFLSAASPNNNRQASDNTQQVLASVKPIQTASNAATSCELSNTYPSVIRRWCDPIIKYSNQYNLDPNLIAAVIEIESGGNPQAYSPDGAVGLMQIMPSDGIAAEFMCGGTSCFASRPSAAELLNPDANIAYGAHILAGLIQRNGNVRDALFRYGPINEGYSYADRVLQIYQRHS